MDELGVVEIIALATRSPADAASVMIAFGPRGRARLAAPAFVGALAAACGWCDVRGAAATHRWSDADVQTCAVSLCSQSSKRGPGGGEQERCLFDLAVYACSKDLAVGLRAALDLTGTRVQGRDALLLVCCDAGATACASLLLDAFGSDPDAGYGLVPFRAAAGPSPRAMLETVLRAGARAERGLMHAVQFGDAAAVRVLTPYLPPQAANEVREALVCGCRFGRADVVRALCEWRGGLAVRVGAGPALAAACRSGHRETVGTLLDAGADVNEGGLALLASAFCGRADLVAMLLAVGADPLAHDGDAVAEACAAGHVAVAALLLDSVPSSVSSDWEAERRNALHKAACRAAARGNESVVTWLIVERGAPVDARTLCAAISSRSMGTLRAALTSGPNGCVDAAAVAAAYAVARDYGRFDAEAVLLELMG